MIREPDKTPEEEQAKEERRRKLDALAETLLKKRDYAVIFRSSSGVERRWREDQQAFDADSDTTAGNAMIDYATGEASPRGNAGPVRSRVIVNVIRGKSETAEGRFCDIMMPVDDRNWGLKVTPVPELVKGLGDDRIPINTQTGQQVTDASGQPIRTSDIARSQMDKAKRAMKGMEDEIDDQLAECNYNGECRKIIRGSVRLGTGILKGPNIVKRVRKAYVVQRDADNTSAHILQEVEVHEPESRWVDCWNVYPDPECGEDVKRTCSYIWEVEDCMPRDLMGLVNVEGYFNDQIMLALEEEPQRTQASYKNKWEIKKEALSRGHAYEKWTYSGDVDKEDLESLGVSCADLNGKSLSAHVVFINDRPIKIQLNVLDVGGIPYDFFQWTVVAGSPWGIGIPRQCLWMQRILVAAWRAMMDNARDSAGANVAVGKGVAPVDGRWELTGKKIWRILDGSSIDDVRKAFTQFQLTSNQKELQAIIELALRFLDMETMIPMLFQGEKGEMPETLGATNIMVDSNNVGLRSRVKWFDDQITVPHLTRYYHWNMQYNENPDIKGDFNVKALGASVLLARDQQMRYLVNLFSLRGDPKVDAEVDWGKATRQLFEAAKIDVLKSDEDKKRDQENRKNQPKPQDPKLQVAKIRADGEMQKAKLVQNSDMAELEFKAQEAEKQRQHEAMMKELDAKIKMMEFSQQSGLSLQQIKADLSKEASRQNLQRELSDKDRAAQVATPPTEPAGRAAPGRAYEQ